MNAQQYFAEHGITKESIERFSLTASKEKITIPIKDKEGTVLFNKYRHLGEEGGKYSYDKGSSATLFNPQGLEDMNFVFLCEGEMDAIRLDQEDIPAVSFTSGAGVFKEEWKEYFTGKQVYIVYDNDDAGREGAKKVVAEIPTALTLSLPEGIKDVCEYFQKYTVEDFWTLVEEAKKQNEMSFADLCAVFDKWILIPDKNVIRILMATLISHFLTTDPLWMFFVAPPSGSKTEIISTTVSLPFVHMLSDLTAQTLASGIKAKEDPSLLPELTNHILVMKDFTTVLTMRYEDRQIILSQLREIYDGKYSKSFGTGKRFTWEGRLTLIAGVTTIIDTQSAVFQVMGERFVMYRINQPMDLDMAEKALDNYGTEVEMREELRSAVYKFFYSLKIPNVSEVTLPTDIKKALISLASFVVKARSGVVRDNYKKEITYIPEPEAPARFVKQLGTLIKSLAILDGRNTVSWKDYYLTLKVALDVIPNNRTRHLIALCGKLQMATTSQVAETTDYSPSGSAIILSDLTAFKLVRVVRGNPNMWGLSAKIKGYFKEILPEWSNDIYSVFAEDDPYIPLLKEMIEDTQQEIPNVITDEEWEAVEENL